jgi:hypothetical protein
VVRGGLGGALQWLSSTSHSTTRCHLGQCWLSLTASCRFQTVSWSPRVVVARNFLSKPECEFIKRAAAPQVCRVGA